MSMTEEMRTESPNASNVSNASNASNADENANEMMIRLLTLYFVPISFAIILLIGLIGNTLVITVVSNVMRYLFT